MRDKFIQAHMKVAETYAELSSARRLHVGAIIVKDDRIISIGYNGMPAGWDNNCEDKIYCDDGDWSEQQLPKTQNLPWLRYKLVTKPEVLHAETNAIAKLAKSTESGDGASIFITHAPCLDCAKLVYQSGINSVYYRNSYRNEDGIKFLEHCKVKVTQV
jgi:dCMP deaminase